MITITMFLTGFYSDIQHLVAHGSDSNYLPVDTLVWSNKGSEGREIPLFQGNLGW